MNQVARYPRPIARPFAFALPIAPSLAMREILSVSAADHPIAACFDELQQIRTDIRYLASIDDLALARPSPGRAFAAAAINMDSFLARPKWLDALCRTRRAVPDLPIILMSEQFAQCDFSTARLFMADVTLSLPLYGPSLFAALIQGVENNTVWQGYLSARPTEKRRNRAPKAPTDPTLG